jgi:hypothetical protein
MIATIAAPVAVNKTVRTSKPQFSRPSLIPSTGSGQTKIPMNMTSVATAAVTAAAHADRACQADLTLDQKSEPVTVKPAVNAASGTAIAAPPTQKDRLASAPIGPSLGLKAGSGSIHALNTHRLSAAAVRVQQTVSTRQARPAAAEPSGCQPKLTGEGHGCMAHSHTSDSNPCRATDTVTICDPRRLCELLTRQSTVNEAPIRAFSAWTSARR